MVGVIITIWLLLQLPVGLAVARFIAGPPRRKQPRATERQRPGHGTIPHAA